MNASVRGSGEEKNHELCVLTSMNGGPDLKAETREIWKIALG